MKPRLKLNLDGSLTLVQPAGQHVKHEGNELKHSLRQRGETLKSFAERNGFRYRTVSDVVRGLRRGKFGEGRDVRVALGLPVEE